MSLLIVSVRVAGRPLETRKHMVDPRTGLVFKHPGYRAGLYGLRKGKNGHWYLALVGELLRKGKPSKQFVTKKSAIEQAKEICEANKDQFLYMEGVKNYTRVEDLPNSDDILTLFDFYEALE